MTVEDGNLPAIRSQGSSPIEVIARVSELAIRRPRKEAEVLKKILAAADETSVWTVPNRGTGLSVKLARTALQCFGNAACLPSIEECRIDVPGKGMVPGWRIQTLIVDMESLAIQATTAFTAKPIRNEGEKDLAYEQRCFQQQLAFAGRIERNAIMKIIPGSWHKQIHEAVLMKAKGRPLAERIKVMIASAKAKGITENQLRNLHGVAPNLYSEAQWADVQGRLAAVQNEDLSVADAFHELFQNGKDSPPTPPVGKTRVHPKSAPVPPPVAESETPLADEIAYDAPETPAPPSPATLIVHVETQIGGRANRLREAGYTWGDANQVWYADDSEAARAAWIEMKKAGVIVEEV